MSSLDGRILVTGGAGFIGSALVWALNQRGHSDIVITDFLGTDEKCKNLTPLKFAESLEAGSLAQGARFIYASSAATYGDGAQGMDDRDDNLARLRPLNMYGYSKHLFDLHAQRVGWLSRIVGVKYFNVFGPNEDHKGDM